MVPVVLKCGNAPLPLALRSLDVLSVPALPDKDDFDEAFAKIETSEKPRLIVVGDDAAFAAALTRLMRTDRLHVEPTPPTPTDCAPAPRPRRSPCPVSPVPRR